MGPPTATASGLVTMTAGEARGPRGPRAGFQARHTADPTPDLLTDRVTDLAGRVLRWAGLGGVVLIALVAAVTSYDHLRSLGEWAGEGWRAWIVPLSVDGLLLTASMTAGALCWVGMAVGTVASLPRHRATRGDAA